MPSLPSATILVIASPSTPGKDYGAFIDDEHSVDVVHSKDELPSTPTQEYDLVFIDDRHPDLHPGEIDSHLAPEAMLTLITGTDSPERIGQGYDEFLVRPVSAREFERTVESLRVRQAYIERIDEHYEVARRMAEIEAKGGEPHGDQQYRTLRRRIRELQVELTALQETLSSVGEPAKIFYDLHSEMTTDAPERPPAVVN